MANPSCILILGNPLLPVLGTSVANSANLIIQGTTQKLAWKYIPGTTSPIESVDVCLNKNGTVTGMNLTLEVQSDSSDAPSGSTLGSATAAFAGPATAGAFNGTLRALGSNTGNLTVGTPVWIVLSYSSGTTPDGTNNVQSKQIQDLIHGQEKNRHHNGTDWTTTAATSLPGLFIVKHVDGTYGGVPITASVGNYATATDIFGNNRQGLKFRVGSQQTLKGVRCVLTRTSTPSNLEVMIYQGSTEIAGPFKTEVAVSLIASNAIRTVLFGADVTIDPDEDCYLVLRQVSDGGDNSNDYDLRGQTIESAYIDALAPPQWRMVYGTGNDPTAYSVATDFFPLIAPVFGDPATDFDSTGGAAGGLLVHPGMDGGFSG